MSREWLEKRLLKETMDVYVQGYQDNSLLNLDDICHWLGTEVLVPIREKLPPEIKQALTKTFYEMITPDGSYYSDGNEVINVYVEGWPQEVIPQLLQEIKYHLDERKIKYGPFKQEKSGMYEGNVVRIPILQAPTEKDIPARLNLSNDKT